MPTCQLTAEQYTALTGGFNVTLSLPVDPWPKNINGQAVFLANHPVKRGKLLTGVSPSGETVPLVVIGIVQLNLERKCLDVPVASQFEVLL